MLDVERNGDSHCPMDRDTSLPVCAFATEKCNGGRTETKTATKSFTCNSAQDRDRRRTWDRSAEHFSTIVILGPPAVEATPM